MNTTWEDMPNQCPAFAYGHLLKLRDGHAFIVSNGSKWAGDLPDLLLSLLRVLKKYTLEKWSHIEYPVAWVGPTQPPIGAAVLFGNFQEVSHGYQIYTDSPRLIAAWRKRAVFDRTF